MKRDFSTNKVDYSAYFNSKKEPVFSVVNPEKTVIPKSLYKYYRVNNCSYKNSVDAFTKHYLFASHPENLNDKYDCSSDLIDYSQLTIQDFITSLGKLINMSEEKVRQLYSSSKNLLEITLADLTHTVMFMKFGVISLTEVSDSILMWAYYSENSGFVLKFKTDLLPKNSFFGPFPINYMENYEKIDCTQYENPLCVLYQSNVKNIMWKPENEWRYLVYNSDGSYHPKFSPDNSHTRKCDYNPKAVEEVILGYDFFSINEIDFNNRTPEYDIINLPDKSTPQNWKIKFLDYLIQENIPCSQIRRNRYNIELGSAAIKIEKTVDNKYKVFNSFKKPDIL